MKTAKNKIEFTRINNDINGNPRYVCHFLNLVNENDRQEIDLIAQRNPHTNKLSEQYAIAVKRANKIGGVLRCRNVPVNLKPRKMKNLIKKINGTEVEISYRSALPSGYGHYKITGDAYISGGNCLSIKYTTSNMGLIDAFKSDESEFPQNFYESLEQVENNILNELFDKNEGAITEWVSSLEEELK